MPVAVRSPPRQSSAKMHCRHRIRFPARRRADRPAESRAVRKCAVLTASNVLAPTGPSAPRRGAPPVGEDRRTRRIRCEATARQANRTNRARDARRPALRRRSPTTRIRTRPTIVQRANVTRISAAGASAPEARHGALPFALVGQRQRHARFGVARRRQRGATAAGAASELPRDRVERRIPAFALEHPPQSSGVKHAPRPTPLAVRDDREMPRRRLEQRLRNAAAVAVKPRHVSRPPATCRAMFQSDLRR